MMKLEFWKGKLGRDKKGDHSLNTIIFMVISVILGVITQSFKFNHTIWHIISQDMARINLTTNQISLDVQNQAFVHMGAERDMGNPRQS